MSETKGLYTFEEFVRRKQKRRALLGLAPAKVIRRGESTRTGTRVHFIRKPGTNPCAIKDSKNHDRSNRGTEESRQVTDG